MIYEMARVMSVMLILSNNQHVNAMLSRSLRKMDLLESSLRQRSIKGAVWRGSKRIRPRQHRLFGFVRLVALFPLGGFRTDFDEFPHGCRQRGGYRHLFTADRVNEAE